MAYKLYSLSSIIISIMAAAAPLLGAGGGEAASHDGGGGSAAAGASGRGGAGSAGRGGSGGDSGGAGGTTGTGGGGGSNCSPGCARTDYCHLASGCGPGTGTCVPRPQDCITPEQIVCGCDGKRYANECTANSSGGVDIQAMTGCPAPSGMFWCGTILCAHATQYCQVRTREGSISNGYACVDLPICDPAPSCACVMTSSCYSCTASANGDLTAMCVAS